MISTKCFVSSLQSTIKLFITMKPLLLSIEYALKLGPISCIPRELKALVKNMVVVGFFSPRAD